MDVLELVVVHVFYPLFYCHFVEVVGVPLVIEHVLLVECEVVNQKLLMKLGVASRRLYRHVLLIGDGFIESRKHRRHLACLLLPVNVIIDNFANVPDFRLEQAVLESHPLLVVTLISSLQVS